jgi:RimJ/RimL family protein N-acetyltransferase
MFETERCVIRDWRPDEAERAFDIYRRWEVAQWLGATPQALEEQEQATRLVARWNELNQEHPDEGRWAIERKSDGAVVGTVILVRRPDGAGEFEVGWHLHPECWGQGFATEAARGVIGAAFDRGLEEVFAVVRPDNAASIAVCRRLGMEELGRTDRYYGTELELFRLGAADRQPAHA